MHLSRSRGQQSVSLVGNLQEEVIMEQLFSVPASTRHMTHHLNRSNWTAQTPSLGTSAPLATEDSEIPQFC